MPVAPTKTQAAKTYVRQVTIAHADERISFVEDFLEDDGNVLHGHAAIKAYPEAAVDDRKRMRWSDDYDEYVRVCF